eukprot:GILJ01003973.1.p1 GENE.GILJ01003973.1~~GILJ01003973.1.p1  ORF type:complete len:222 (-),score=30.94 GILJ01003973.1:895-1560(-)
MLREQTTHIIAKALNDATSTDTRPTKHGLPDSEGAIHGSSIASSSAALATTASPSPRALVPAPVVRGVSTSPDNDRDLSLAGPILLQFNAFDASTQAHACWQLAKFAAAQDNGNRVSLVRGGLRLVLAAMCRFPECEEVQRNACVALAVLANNDENCVAIATAGGIAFVVAMRAFPLSVDVQREACWALGMLSKSNETDIATVAARGVVSIVAAILTATKS